MVPMLGPDQPSERTSDWMPNSSCQTVRRRPQRGSRRRRWTSTRHTASSAGLDGRQSGSPVSGPYGAAGLRNLRRRKRARPLSSPGLCYSWQHPSSGRWGLVQEATLHADCMHGIRWILRCILINILMLSRVQVSWSLTPNLSFIHRSLTGCFCFGG